MSEEILFSAPAPDQQYEPPAALYGSPTAPTRMDEALDYPAPYSRELARQWAAEDPNFHEETYRQDPYYDKEEQAELRRRIEEVRSGRATTVPWELVRQEANALQN